MCVGLFMCLFVQVYLCVSGQPCVHGETTRKAFHKQMTARKTHLPAKKQLSFYALYSF